MLRLQGYKYKVIYMAGKSNIADVFSRMCQEGEKAIPFDTEAEMYVSAIVEVARPIALQLIEIQEASSNDTEIAMVKEAMNSGLWHNNDKLILYKRVQEELCFAGKIGIQGLEILLI